MKKIFVLDTNVLLHNADAVHSFGDNTVVLPMAVIEELDTFKTRNDELGRNSRKVIRDLDMLRSRGRLGEGVSMENGGMLKIIAGKGQITETGLDIEIPDNKILGVAFNLHREGGRVIFVSQDINARLKADAIGVETMDFEKQKVNFDEFFENNTIELEALTYIRGRSIPQQYVIIDEAQNLTPHEVKTIISRAGEGTKMVLTGNPCQIDNPYLDSSSNGLTYAVERLKEQSIHGHITLRKSERSPLAAVAADLL